MFSTEIYLISYYNNRFKAILGGLDERHAVNTLQQIVL